MSQRVFGFIGFGASLAPSAGNFFCKLIPAAEQRT